MRVLMIVQQVDERNWLRGFTVAWIRALAAEVEHVHVLALEVSQPDVSLPDNVTVQSMGKERGVGRLRELIAFYGGIARVIRDVDVVFSHMTPRYTWLAAPLAVIFRKPQMLWFTHRKVSMELRAALFVARWAVTASPESFPIKGKKVHVMGHGIDTEKFSPGPDDPDQNPAIILAVGRISPIKKHDVLLEAAALLKGEPLRFIIAGQPAAPGDDEYQQALLDRRAELGLSDEKFMLAGALSMDEMVALYRRASLVTNLSPPGLFDKAALEAMLTATPVIVANPIFNLDDAFLVRDANDPREVADRIRAVMALSAEERARIGAELRQRTASEHGLSRLMARIVALIAHNAIN
jgi:glycosyltransferase involved in cell wall biosynthesis